MTAGTKMLQTRFIGIRYLPGCPKDLVEGLGVRADKAIEDVGAYLGVPPPLTAVIDIAEQRSIPSANRERSLIIVPQRRLPHRSAVVHELTHLMAGTGAYPGSSLDEGLAVYLQAKFGGPGDLSFPTQGRDLHEETLRTIAMRGARLPLAKAAQARTWQRPGIDRTLAYLEEGSFARFLIERYGLNRFLRVYDGSVTSQEAFGRSAAELEMEWWGELQTLACRQTARQVAGVGSRP